MVSSKCDSRDKFQCHRESCRLCLMERSSFVDIFETMTIGGCALAEKLNESFGIDAFLGDELPRIVCMDCLRQIKGLGNIGYDLWSTLESLLRMDADDEMPISSFSIPEDSLDFLFQRKSRASPSYNEPCDHIGTNSGAIDGGSVGKEIIKDDYSQDGEASFEYCWCTVCNAEFVTRKELKMHLETHVKSPCFNKNVNTHAVEFTEEYKLLSGKKRLLRNNLCCGMCEKQFKNVQRLVKHIDKYDFKCKPKRFEHLNALLKTVRSSKGNEDISMLRSKSREDACGIPSKCYAGKSSLTDGICNSRDEDERLNRLGIDLKENLSGESSNRNFQHGIRHRYPKITGKDSINLRLNQSLTVSNDQIFSPYTSSKEDKVKDSVVNNVIKVKPINDHCSFMRRRISEDVSLMEKNGVDETVDSFLCDYCKKSYQCKSKLREHIVICHLSPAVRKCSECYREFASEEELKTHYALHSSMNKYICTLCNENTSSRKKLIEHLHRLHNSSMACVCFVCFSGFPSRFELGLHQYCHSSEKKFKCPKCSKKFLTKPSFDRHVKFCQQMIPYKCEVCGKEYRMKKSLHYHSFVHGDFKGYPCSQCPRRFRHIAKMYRHIRIVHLKLKPHECGICKRRFGLRHYLIQHYAVHSDDRPFKCEHCGKTFKLKNQRGTHIQKIHCK